MSLHTSPAFRAFCLDHLINFDTFPCEYEDEQGNEYDYDTIWFSCEKLVVEFGGDTETIDFDDSIELVINGLQAS